jgi:hypothetical protein
MQGLRASFHYHRKKTESFYLLEGRVLLLHSKNYKALEKNKDEVKKLLEYAEHKNLESSPFLKIYDCKFAINYDFLNPGEVFHLEPFTVHQVIALSDSKIIEFSTHSEDSDSIRIVES